MASIRLCRARGSNKKCESQSPWYAVTERYVWNGQWLTNMQVLASVLKWCWSRLQGGVVSWDAYELFKIGELGKLPRQGSISHSANASPPQTRSSPEIPSKPLFPLVLRVTLGSTLFLASLSSLLQLPPMARQTDSVASSSPAWLLGGPLSKGTQAMGLTEVTKPGKSESSRDRNCL